MLQILDMPNLVELYLESNSFTAGDLSGLNNLPNLQFLILHGNPISKILDSLCVKNNQISTFMQIKKHVPTVKMIAVTPEGGGTRTIRN